MRWLVTASLLVAGCFTKPDAPGANDDARTDSAPVLISGGTRRVITVTQPPTSELTRFPVQVAIDGDTDLALAGTAAQIAFASMDGVALPCDIVRYDPQGDLEAWVTMPTLSASATQFVLAYGPGLSVQDACNASDAWSDYTAAWHFNDSDPSRIRDSSPNALHLDVRHGLPVPTMGLAGDAMLFHNTDGNGPDELCVPDSPPLQFATRSFSYEAWLLPIELVDTYDVALYKGAKNAGYAGFDLELGTGNWTAWIRDSAPAGSDRPDRASFTSDPTSLGGKWNHLVVTIDRASMILRTYLNGVPTETDSPLETMSVTGPEPLCVGDFNQPSHAIFDEFRIREGVVPAQWVLATYRNQTMSEFLSIGPPTRD